jgi:glutamate racemase
MVECGARTAIRKLGTDAEQERGAIGVMSTPGTYASGVYPTYIEREAAGVGAGASPEVVAVGCENLADSIQFGRHNLDAIVRHSLRGLIGKLAQTRGRRRLRAVILGCSHYALALDHFRSALDDIRHDPELGPLVADDCSFIDPAVETARQCRDLLASDGLLARRGGPSNVAMFVSAPCADLPRRLIAPDGTLDDGYKYTRPQGRFVLDTKFVPLHEGFFDREHFKTLLGVLPHVRKALARQL